jgi:hypothetical protein
MTNRAAILIHHSPMNHNALSNRLCLMLRGQVVIECANDTVPEYRPLAR